MLTNYNWELMVIKSVNFNLKGCRAPPKDNLKKSVTKTSKNGTLGLQITDWDQKVTSEIPFDHLTFQNENLIKY